MSSAQLGISVAKMIRAGKVSGISCTGANLEEDIFNLVVRRRRPVLVLCCDRHLDERALLLRHRGCVVLCFA